MPTGKTPLGEWFLHPSVMGNRVKPRAATPKGEQLRVAITHERHYPSEVPNRLSHHIEHRFGWIRARRV